MVAPALSSMKPNHTDSMTDDDTYQSSLEIITAMTVATREETDTETIKSQPQQEDHHQDGNLPRFMPEI